MSQLKVRAADAGVAQELAFFVQPMTAPSTNLSFGSAALPFARQPILVVYDGFGDLLPEDRPQFDVTTDLWTTNGSSTFRT